MHITKSLAVAAVSAAAMLSTVPAQTSSAATMMAPTKAIVTIVHGIPNTPVDVYVNRQKTLTDFTFGKVAGPLSLTPGTYYVAIRPHGAAQATAPILSGTEHLVAGENATIVANLTAAGAPTLSVFANPTTELAAGKTRIIVRHLAEAPAVDVYAGSTKIISSLVNGSGTSLTIGAAKVAVAVTVAGQPLASAVIGPVSINFPAKTTTIVYAIGSATGSTLKPVLQTYAS